MGAVERVPVAARTASQPPNSPESVAMCERSITGSVPVGEHVRSSFKRSRHGGARRLRAHRIDKALPCGSAGGSDL